MNPYVITLEPSQELYKRIMMLKNKAREIVGEQLYLSDEPHLTLYISHFKDENKLSTVLSAFATEAIKLKKDIPCTITTWHIFKGDRVARRDTLCCLIGLKEAKLLQQMQIAIVTKLNPIRTKDICKRYEEAYNYFSDEERANVDLYGYPFIGNVWIPHISIASFIPDVLKNVWQELENACPTGTYSFSSLNCYTLDEMTDTLKRIKRYKLH